MTDERSGGAPLDPLDPDAWDRIAPILDAVLDAEEGERPNLLDDACGDDAELRRTVERLLDAAEPATTFLLDRPAAESAASLLAAGLLDAGLSARAAYSPGDVIAGYRIDRLIGRGGMGEVFRAYYATLDRDAALKVLPAHLAGSPEARRRLIHEARAASRLDHPNIQTVFDAGETEDGGVFIALAFYDGSTLAERLAEESRPPLADALAVAGQLANGLAAAHATGIVHRDVKPSNLMLLDDGRLKILDFGVARMSDRPITREGATYGTIAYMSPEQTHGAPADPRADAWAFGVVLYEMLAGRRPFRGSDDRTLIHAIRHDEPPPLEALRPAPPGWLSRLVERCLRKDPAERPDMSAACLELEAAGKAEPGGAGEPSARPRWRALAHRKRAIVGAAVAVLLAVAVGAMVLRQAAGDATTSEPGSVRAEAVTMTVLPFLSVAGDSATARLGRQLAITVSTNLNGVGTIRTPEGLAVLTALGAEADDSVAVVTPDDAAAVRLARRFGTGSYLRGTLIRADGNVRVDAAVHDGRSGEEIGRLATAAAAGDIAALTDSVTLAVLRAVWRRGVVPAPSFAALTTGSLPALRVYLEGELHLAAGEFGPAIAAFDSAFRADSTFWYARWRSVYPRTYEPTVGLAPEAWDELYEHRAALPEPARLVVEASRLDGLSLHLAALRDVTHRHPTYWPGWWSYTNFLVHRGLLMGLDLDEVRTALERTLELQPRFLPAWEHLLWVAVRQRDARRAGDALAELERAGRTGNPRLNRDLLPTYRMLGAALADPDLSSVELAPKVEHGLIYGGPLPTVFVALDVLLFGECAAQRTLNWASLAREPRAELADYQRYFFALSLACTGDWNAAVARLAARPVPALSALAPVEPYGFAVVGAWLGEVPPAAAAALRPASPLAGAADAERLWLDGLLAVAERRPDRVDDVRARLASHEATHAARLERSLAAFLLGMEGDSVTAGRRLADLEEQGVESAAYDAYGAPHPWLTAVDRLAAARWLAAEGDTTRALDLLGWEDAFLDAQHFLMDPAGQVVMPRASLLRGRLLAARGDSVRAAFHYETVRRRYDRPAAAVAAALAEAEAYPRP